MKCHTGTTAAVYPNRSALRYAAALLWVLLPGPGAIAQPNPLVESNQTVTYEQCISYYRDLDQRYGQARLIECGPTDSGKPLHLFVINPDGRFDPGAITGKKLVMMIMNGIHPGEPDGIDASMQLAGDLLAGRLKEGLLTHTVLCIIPSYNIDGMLNRGCCSRANQNGPLEYGFRGNARNLDLNRDFIKADAENTRSFIRLFHEWDPDVFIDTHVSNGADYPYTMTLISTQHNKLHPVAGTYLKNSLTPALFDGMRERGDEMVPYVNTLRYGDSPDEGIYGFMDSPRYSTGFAALFSTLGFVSETHMLKPFPQRVASTYRLLHTLLEASNSDAARIKALRKEAKAGCAAMKQFALEWMPDTTSYELLAFRGYEQKSRNSGITGRLRTYYDQQAPYEKEIRFYDTYVPRKVIAAPLYYLIPQAWKEVIGILQLNGVDMVELPADTSLTAEVYYIENYSTSEHPYEGRYAHSRVEVKSETQSLSFLRGDVLVPVNQEKSRFIVETLEPEATDSWFNWGFFDAVLQQKEWFSSYVFEEQAMELLQDDPSLKQRFELKKNSDTAFANNAFLQLYFIYRHSRFFEPSYNRYPVARIHQPLEMIRKRTGKR